MAEKTILVCDVCGAEPAHAVALRVGRANWRKDLCEDHLTELLNGARRPKRGARPGTRRVTPATHKVNAQKTTRGRKTRARRARPTRTNQDVAAQMRRLRDSGLSYRQIGDALIKEGFKPQRAKAWNPVVIGRLLKRTAA